MAPRFTGLERNLYEAREKWAENSKIACDVTIDKKQYVTSIVFAGNDTLKYIDNALNSQEKIALEDCGRRVLGSMKIAIFEIGCTLFEARALIRRGCERGTWSRWLSSLDISEATARNYLAAYEWERECPKIRDLPRSVIYQGAAAPSEVRSEIESMLARKQIITRSYVRTLLQAHRQHANKSDLKDCKTTESADLQLKLNKSADKKSRIALQLATMLRLKFCKEDISLIIRLLAETSSESISHHLEIAC